MGMESTVESPSSASYGINTTYFRAVQHATFEGEVPAMAKAVYTPDSMVDSHLDQLGDFLPRELYMVPDCGGVLLYAWMSTDHFSTLKGGSWAEAFAAWLSAHDVSEVATLESHDTHSGWRLRPGS